MATRQASDGCRGAALNAPTPEVGLDADQAGISVDAAAFRLG